MTATNSNNNSDTNASSQRSSTNDRVSGAGAAEAVRGTNTRYLTLTHLTHHPSSPSPFEAPKYR